MKKILSLDGGGIFGILPSIFLAELESAAQKPCYEIFDLMAGTSTGGIIACGLHAGLPASQLVDLYVNQGAIIFPDIGWIGKIRLLDGPLYDATPLEKILDSLLGDARLSDDHPSHMLATAVCVSSSPPDAYLFRSAIAKASATDDFYLRDVARATSAAPVYFAPAAISDMASEKKIFVDGGLFANNPSMKASSEAYRLWPDEKHFVVSLGTGMLSQPIDLGNGSAEAVLPYLPSIFMDSQASSISEDAAEWLQPDYRRYDVDLGMPLSNGRKVNEAMDDASPENIAAIVEIAQRMVAECDMGELLRLLG